VGGAVSVGVGGCCGRLPSFAPPLVWIWALPVDVSDLVRLARCRDSRVVGRWLVEGSLSASSSRF
jgi:hypothetical protein